MEHDDIIDFWFNQITPKQHWVKETEFDHLITARFSVIHRQARLGELAHWRACSEGRLAEIIILDQFSRNMFRDTAKSFTFDGQALVLAQEAIGAGVDLKLPPSKRCFLYMPFMHSESLNIHKQALRLFNQPGLEDNYDFEAAHYQIIQRFGRYPHRNKILGRTSTPLEIEFLAGPDSSF